MHWCRLVSGGNWTSGNTSNNMRPASQRCGRRLRWLMTIGRSWRWTPCYADTRRSCVSSDEDETFNEGLTATHLLLKSLIFCRQALKSRTPNINWKQVLRHTATLLHRRRGQVLLRGFNVDRLIMHMSSFQSRPCALFLYEFCQFWSFSTFTEPSVI